MSRELVLAWRDVGPGAVREGLERALINVGIEPIGEPGEVVSFDGALHDSDEDLISGDAVEVTEPGWRFRNARGEFLLARARVVRAGPAARPAESEADRGRDVEHRLRQ